MYAVIETGGKQYRVCQGDKIKVEKLDIKEGEKVTFDKVLVISDNGIKVGKPYLEGAKVEGKVLLQSKDKKVVVYKYKAKKNQRSKKGHRQPFSLVEIENIG
ncbi:50S ribosomal protein L21 [Peptoniphilus lacrimalis]|uniref:50S ribosomal protein L21 n=1 Tax=Peptoniphilus lacrimalis TaxID=33031 RepID=UPI00254CA2EC|nr:50S ribosomal protein L21 [Peptoniphilus lacrimalis]MDK7721635.1 50S ribosomal protein L21 [Peptoniphilus lacrimalis]MDK7731237.1 50S ribosomal protein L21 [Peptoniphilus lacrimalis]